MKTRMWVSNCHAAGLRYRIGSFYLWLKGFQWRQKQQKMLVPTALCRMKWWRDSAMMHEPAMMMMMLWCGPMMHCTPVTLPAGPLFTKPSTYRCLTSVRGGYVGVSRVMQQQNEKPNHPVSFLCSLIISGLTRGWCETALQFLQSCTRRSKKLQMWWFTALCRDRFTLWGATSLTLPLTHACTHLTYGLTFGIWPQEGSAWKERCAFWRPATTNFIGYRFQPARLQTWPPINKVAFSQHEPSRFIDSSMCVDGEQQRSCLWLYSQTNTKLKS